MKVKFKGKLMGLHTNLILLELWAILGSHTFSNVHWQVSLWEVLWKNEMFWDAKGKDLMCSVHPRSGFVHSLQTYYRKYTSYETEQTGCVPNNRLIYKEGLTLDKVITSEKFIVLTLTKTSDCIKLRDCGDFRNWMGWISVLDLRYESVKSWERQGAVSL